MSDPVLNTSVIRNSIDLNALNSISLSAGGAVNFGTSAINVNNTKIRGVVNMEDLILSGTINTRLQSSIFNIFEENLINNKNSQSRADQYGAVYGPTYGDNLGVLNAHGSLIGSQFGGYVGNVYNQVPDIPTNANLAMPDLDQGLVPQPPAPVNFYTTNYSIPYNIDWTRPNLNNFDVLTYNRTGIEGDLANYDESLGGFLYWPTDTGKTDGNVIFRWMTDYNQLSLDVALNGPDNNFSFSSNLSLSQPYLDKPPVRYVPMTEVNGYVLSLETTGTTTQTSGNAIHRVSDGAFMGSQANIDVPFSINNPNLNGNINILYPNALGGDPYNITADVFFSNAVLYKPTSTIVYRVPDDTTTKVTQIDFPTDLFGEVNGVEGNIIYPNVDTQVNPSDYPDTDYFTDMINTFYQSKMTTYYETQGDRILQEIDPNVAVQTWNNSTIYTTLTMPTSEYYILYPDNTPVQTETPDLYTGFVSSYIKYYAYNPSAFEFQSVLKSYTNLYTLGGGAVSNFNQKFWYYDTNGTGGSLISGTLTDTPDTDLDQPLNPSAFNDSSVVPSLIANEAAFFVLGPYTSETFGTFFQNPVYLAFTVEGQSEENYDYFSVATNILKSTDRTNNASITDILQYWTSQTNSVAGSQYKFVYEPIAGSFLSTEIPPTLVSGGLEDGDQLYIIFMYTKDSSISIGNDGFKIKDIYFSGASNEVILNMDRTLRITSSIPAEINFPPNNPTANECSIIAGNLQNQYNMIAGSAYLVIGPLSYEDFTKENITKLYPSFNYAYYPSYNASKDYQFLEVYRSNLASPVSSIIMELLNPINSGANPNQNHLIFNSATDTINAVNNWNRWDGTTNENSVLYKSIDDYDYVYYTFKYTRNNVILNTNQTMFISNIQFNQNPIGNTQYFDQYIELQAGTNPNVYVNFNKEVGYYLPKANVKYAFQNGVGSTTQLRDPNNILLNGTLDGATFNANLSNIGGIVKGEFSWTNQDCILRGNVRNGGINDGNFTNGNLDLYYSDVEYFRNDFYQYAWHANGELSTVNELFLTDISSVSRPFANISGNVILQCGLFSEYDGSDYISRPIWDNQVATLIYRYKPPTNDPFVINFKYQLYSELRGDFFYFQYSTDDGNTFYNLIKQSGDIKSIQSVSEINTFWKQASFYLPYSSEYLFRWAYEKDINIDNGYDTVVLADIEIGTAKIVLDSVGGALIDDLGRITIDTNGNLYGYNDSLVPTTPQTLQFISGNVFGDNKLYFRLDGQLVKVAYTV